MIIDPIFLVYGMVAVGVVLAIEGIYYLVSDARPGTRAANRRMRMLGSGLDAEKVLLKLSRAGNINWHKFGALGSPLKWLNDLISQSGVLVSTPHVLLFMVLMSLFCFSGISYLLARSPHLPSANWGVATYSLILLASLTIGIGGPIVRFLIARKRRRNLFSEQLPDALDMMVRSLRVGHPVGVAIGLAAEQMPDPIGSAFGMAVDEMTYGLDLPEAMANLGDRVDVPDFKYVVMSISIQSETGGNLADVLSGLSMVIRSRFRMFKKVRALSAEGRFSAKILAGLPFAFVAMVFTMQPNYYLNVIDEPMFIKIMTGALVLQIFGIYVMHKMINFRV